MSEFDLHTIIDDRNGLDNTLIGSNTTTVGNIIDTKGFESIEFVVHTGSIVDGAFAWLLEQGDDAGLSDATVVPVGETLGSLVGFDNTNDDETQRVGSIGKQRYQRFSIVSTGVTTGGTFSVTAILGTPHTGPVAQ